MSRRDGTIRSRQILEPINLARYSGVLASHSENRRESIPGWPHGKEPLRSQKVQKIEITWKGATSSAVAMDRIISKVSI